jgi:hypothetical protein
MMQVFYFIILDYADGERDKSNSKSLNNYSYCVNNPLKYTDPSGNMFIIGEDDFGNPIQMNSKGELSPNAYPSAPNKPTQQPKQNEPEMPVENEANDEMTIDSAEGGWTFGIGTNGQISFLGWGASGSVMIVTSGEGEVGMVISGGAGGGAGYQPGVEGLGAGGAANVSIQAQWTNANSIEELEGLCVQTGGSAAYGYGGSFEWVTGKNYNGFNVQFIPFGKGFEFHSLVESAWTWTWFRNCFWAND